MEKITMRRILAAITMATLVAALSGCIILPFGDHGGGGEHGGGPGGPGWHMR
jgi:hypothetical protein